jgi:hypothetical protein
VISPSAAARVERLADGRHLPDAPNRISRAVLRPNKEGSWHDVDLVKPACFRLFRTCSWIICKLPALL